MKVDISAETVHNYFYNIIHNTIVGAQNETLCGAGERSAYKKGYGWGWKTVSLW